MAEKARNIIEAQARKDLLGAARKDPASWKNWDIVSKLRYGLPLSDDEWEIAQIYTGRTLRPAGPFKTIFIIVGRRGGKSSWLALTASWEAISQNWGRHLARGERVYVVVVAVDKAQAQTIMRYVKGIFSSTSTLKAMVASEKSEELELKNSVSIIVKTANFRSLRGMTIGLFCGDEVAFWRSEDSANPDSEILAAVRPALTTVDGSIVCISTPWARRGAMYDAFKSYYGNDESPVLVWKAPSIVMNARLKKEYIDAQILDDPAANRAEWLAEFREDVERFLSPDILEPCIIPGRGDLPPVTGLDYQFFCDPSGGRSDSMTLCCSHTNDDGVLVVDLLRERKPPFSPAEVVAEYCALVKSYACSRVISDKFGSEWVAESFRAHDVHIKYSEQSASESYLELLPRITNRTIQLPDSKKLVAQLVGLERHVRPTGGETITHFPGQHDDCANVIALAAAHAKEVGSVRRYEVGYCNDGFDRWRFPTDIAEFRPEDIPPEFKKLCKLEAGIKWLAAVHVADHDIVRASELIGEDPDLMRRFNSRFTGWLGKISNYYPDEIQKAYEKLAKKAGKD